MLWRGTAVIVVSVGLLGAAGCGGGSGSGGDAYQAQVERVLKETQPDVRARKLIKIGYQQAKAKDSSGAEATFKVANKACREGYSALYTRVPRLLHEISIARGDGSYLKLLAKISRIDVLVLDDWGLAPLGDLERRDILEILEDRTENRSTIVASQLPTAKWYDCVGEPTIADAILDRLIHRAHELKLKGPTMRKPKKGKKR